jgi:hypothetical protein
MKAGTLWPSGLGKKSKLRFLIKLDTAVCLHTLERGYALGGVELASGALRKKTNADQRTNRAQDRHLVTR